MGTGKPAMARADVIRRRNFRSALLHMLERQYKIMGSRRVLKLLADDVCDLICEHHLTEDRVGAGELMWAAAPGGKSAIGTRAEDEGVVMVKLPLVTEKDLERAAEITSPSERTRLKVERMVRVIKAAAAQGGYLSLMDVAVIFTVSHDNIAKLLKQWQEENREALPLAGFVKDKGSHPPTKASS